MASYAVAEGGAGSAAPGVSLPAPPTAGAMSLEEALARRRSVREFSKGELTLAEISRLVWAAQGVTDSERRTAPSAGATYPLEVYLVAADVEAWPLESIATGRGCTVWRPWPMAIFACLWPLPPSTRNG